MGEKTAGVGHFCIPTAPAAGTSCTSGAANAFTGTYVVLSASAPSTLFITGVHLESSAALAATYIVIQLATGGAGSETVVGQYLVPLSTASTVALGYRAIYPFIPIPSGTRVTCKTADSVGAKATLVTLECIAQANVVDNGVVVGTVSTVTTVTNQLTGAAIATAVWQDATAGDFTTASSIGKSLYTSGNAPGAASGLQICGSNAATTYATLTSTGAFTVSGVATVSQTGDSFAVVKSGGTGDNAAIKAKTDTLPASPASTTNITAGTITTVTNLTNAPTAGDLTAAMKASVTTAATAATPTAAAVTGAVGSVTGNVGGNVAGSVASVTAAVTLPTIPNNWITAAGINAAALNGKGDWLLSSGYSAPDNTAITAIKAKTDSLGFSVAGYADVNVRYVNSLQITGGGVEDSDEWRPV